MGSQRRGRAGWWVMLLSLALGAMPRAWAGDAAGTWEGHYSCGQGETALVLVLGPGGGGLEGVFQFGALPGNPGVPEGCFAVAGRFDAQSGAVRLSAGRWLRRPWGYVTVDLVGRLDPAGDRMSGQVVGPSCRGFELRRVEAGAAPVACGGGAAVATAGR